MMESGGERSQETAGRNWGSMDEVQLSLCLKEKEGVGQG